MYMLDTNAISAIMRSNATFMGRLRAKKKEEICISSIAWAEIRYGINKKGSQKLLKSSEHLAKMIRILPFTQQTADIYAHLRAEMEKQGKNLSPMDMLIASSALANDCILITNDQAFSHIEVLQIEDWTI